MSVQLRAGVGDGRPNHPEDVALVQLLLNGTPRAGLNIDGRWGSATRIALELFQRAQFGVADRIADPGDITFSRLRGPAVTFHDDALLRSFAVHHAESSGASSGSVPRDSERRTADGLGAVFDWTTTTGFAHIFSHPRWGTWEVRGVILDKYRELSEEAGELGNPISGERVVAPGRVSWFERGHIGWSESDGFVSVGTILG
ncbi:hypothetical protein [Streptomyces sp. NPDC001970]